MAHNTIKSGYDLLTQRLNRFPQGAPPSNLLYTILRQLFSEKEAAMVSLLPIKPFDVELAAAVWRSSPSEAMKMLEDLAGRALILDIERDGKRTYCLPPPMAGFFEFSMMRIRPDLDQKALAELFYQYLNVEEDFIKTLFTKGETQLGRVFVQEPMLDGSMVSAEARKASGQARFTSLESMVPDQSLHGDQDGVPQRRGHVLLPPQDDAPRSSLRRAYGNLHDLQRFGPVTDQVRACPRDRRAGVHEPPRHGLRTWPRAIRRERAAAGQLHMQLLRLLL